MGRTPIRLIALDLDGTLIDRDLRLPDSNRDALRAAGDQGVRIALASGRMTVCIEPFEDALGIDGAVLAYNGAMVLTPRAEGRRRILHRPLPADVAAGVLDFCLENRYTLNFYVDDVLYSQDDPELRRYAEIYSNQTGAVYHFTDLEKLRGERPTKLILVTDPPERDRLYERFRAELEARATVTRTNPEYLEFTAPGVDKGSALPALARHYGLEVSQVMAVGDGDNDAPMLRAAGVGVAVANATELCRRAAHRVTERTVGEGAVAEAIERWVFSR